MRLMGIAAVRWNNRPPGRLRFAWRGLLTWAPIATALTLAIALHTQLIQLGGSVTPWTLFGMAAGLPFLWVLLSLVDPPRGLHDRLSGTYLVPD